MEKALLGLQLSILTLVSICVVLLCAIYYTNQRDNYYIESRREFNQSVMQNLVEQKRLNKEWIW